MTQEVSVTRLNVLCMPCSSDICAPKACICVVPQEGKPLVLSAVRKAEQRLVADLSRNKEYRPMGKTHETLYHVDKIMQI